MCICWWMNCVTLHWIFLSEDWRRFKPNSSTFQVSEPYISNGLINVLYVRQLILRNNSFELRRFIKPKHHLFVEPTLTFMTIPTPPIQSVLKQTKLSTFWKLTPDINCERWDCKFDIRASMHHNIIPNYRQQDATFLDLFMSTDALHVSGGSSGPS
jgi:hypothetical protein